MSVKKRTILLLEDDAVQVLLFQGLATDVNDNVVSANNVYDALHVLRTSTIAACVVDLGVYRRFKDYKSDAGIEFIEEARKIGQEGMPILVVTTSRDPSTLIPCFEAGCDDYVLKDEGVHGAVDRLKMWLKSVPIPPATMRSKRAEVLAALRGTLKG
ncbi:response regulator [Thalassobaculum sp.]|uniref:response regulator n=1 Tax=Thalassobaculum sp. TaxID=2022740 RepID=UPI0032F03898